MHNLLDRLLARVPKLYARIVALRTAPNLEKIAFLALVRQGDVVVEVGANVGYYTTLFSHLVGHTGHVHAFEPVATSFAHLRKRLPLEPRYHNLILNQLALGEENGETQMFWPAGDLGQASLVPHRHGTWQACDSIQSHPCRVETLDGYAERHRMSRLDFLKCDVEGAELAVLRGAIETVRRFAPLLHLEVCPSWARDFGCHPADLVAFLQPFGYRSFVLVEAGRIVFLREPVAALTALRLDESANLLCATNRDRDRLEELRRWERPSGTLA